MTSYFKGTDNGVNPIHQGINVLKRPFRITINVIFYTEELETFTADLVFFPCYWEYMVKSPNSGRFLIVEFEL